ncbi:hypothetical protein [Paenibacillus sp. JGP012]|uniref:hypothetical protein n=1 Tax=Paenibacillus sp. JGP012 TaxID=2735914 RepID=UPI001621AD44|nr:hypothetical protein [Paenibacillus sp. JGP012]
MLPKHNQYGQPWKIGLKQSRHLLHSHALRLLITPLRKETTEHYVNQAYVERFHGVELGRFQQIRIVPHDRVALKLF